MKTSIFSSVLALAACTADAATVVRRNPEPRVPVFPNKNLPKHYADPSNLSSYIKKIAAVGDSYSAGIGAGDRRGGFSDWLCSRYDEAYPNVVNGDSRLGDPQKRKFQFLSCSGALLDDVVKKQISSVENDQDVMMISAGGNDAELVHILNHCVFQFASFKNAEEVLKKVREGLKLLDDDPVTQANIDKIDFGKFGRSCEEQLKKSDEIIESKEFSEKLDKAITESKKKISKTGALYYTGYAKFFGEDMSPDCDKVSWGMWIHKLYGVPNLLQPFEYLTVSRRKTMNGLVDKVNAKIADAVKRAGDQVEFVNYDEYVGRFKGRYCESGVDENSDESNMRPELMFYKWNTTDLLGETPWKRTAKASPEGTFSGDVNIMGEIMMLAEPKATFAEVPEVKEDEKRGDGGDDETKHAVRSVLPDGYGRVFHPQVLLHEIISEQVIFRITNRILKQSHQRTAVEIAQPPTSCPLYRQVSVGSPQCDVTKTSKFPGDLFNGERDNSNVYHHFCDTLVKGKSHKMKVNPQGDNRDPEPHLRRRGANPLVKRVGPSPEYLYVDFSVNLEFAANKGVDDKDECGRDECTKAFEELGSTCQWKSSEHLMAKTAKAEKKCGTFSYSIDQPDKMPDNFTPIGQDKPIVCNKKGQFGSGPSYKPGGVWWDNGIDAEAACKSWKAFNAGDDGKVVKGDKSTFKRFQKGDMVAKVEWVDGCTIASDKQEQSVHHPTGNKKDPDCFTYIVRTIGACAEKNSRAMGTHQIGCLNFSLTPYGWSKSSKDL